MSALDGRCRTFLDKYAHPDWQEAERVRQRERRRGRREEERVNRTGKIDRDAIYRRDEGICSFCGKRVDVADFHVHHVRAIARDGAHGPENMHVAHPLCNAQDGARLRGARRMLEMDGG
jgi:5-methylcytosine-specific restriction endonuclease McrA